MKGEVQRAAKGLGKTKHGAAVVADALRGRLVHFSAGPARLAARAPRSMIELGICSLHFVQRHVCSAR
jgi:hypothetical protein